MAGIRKQNRRKPFELPYLSVGGGGGGAVAASSVTAETPVGTINGSNTDFTFTGTLVALYLNGLYQTEGAGNDYTVSGSTITYNTAPVSGMTHTALVQ